jgi:3-hydroxymyristoyl/3-hydroxydecanoyl-(acyl carrier protein) dehydratase
MQTGTAKNILENYTKWWHGHTRQVAGIHNRFLELRQVELRQMAGSIEKQVGSVRPGDYRPARALFTLDDLNEFATGSIVKCLGQEYAVYQGRRGPRIPNGDLLMMSRILSITGRKGEFEQASSIEAEYDVPANSWFFEGQSHGRLPYSICLEVALQPCGFLSAYLGTPLRFPGIDYYFRNLDGETGFTRLVDARGKTIRARAKLLKTIFYGTTIIQHFSFELICDGEIFFAGRSSFGYFSAGEMANQAGLDGKKTVLPWLKQASQESRLLPIDEMRAASVLPKGKLRLLDSVAIVSGAGDRKEGYLYANRHNTPQDWFYACHFHEDPVMPGSLGIEAMIQAMKTFALQRSSGSLFSDDVLGQKMNWSYRGQVLQQHQQMQVELHFHKTMPQGKTNLYTADASLWADDSRIYAVQNMTISIEEEQDRS